MPLLSVRACLCVRACVWFLPVRAVRAMERPTRIPACYAGILLTTAPTKTNKQISDVMGPGT